MLLRSKKAILNKTYIGKTNNIQQMEFLFKEIKNTYI